MAEPELIATRRGSCGHLMLNRPHALNALTLGMVREIDRALDSWEHDKKITSVVIEGAGAKAFCAGGDVRLLYEQGKAKDHAAQIQFWREEYQLNRRIAHYPKPYVAIVDGIVMGGGVGVSMLGSHRVAGDRFAFAMPEVGIGLFPDVGATFFLPRLPEHAGTYLALTGARAKAGDAVRLGLAQAHVGSGDLPRLVAALADGMDPDAAIAACRRPPPGAEIAVHLKLIGRCFPGKTVAAILASLDESTDDVAFARDAAQAIRTKSPTSLAIALRQLQVGKKMTIDEALKTEFRIVNRVCKGHDFYEGVRATIIDKDNKPAWKPAAIADVTTASIDAMFSPLREGELAFAREKEPAR